MAEAKASVPSYRLLVVDDQEGILKTIEVMLRGSPFEPVLVTSGEEAVALAMEQSFDAMLLDVLMPDISGIALCVRLRHIPHLSNVPVVMLTAANDIGLQRRAIAAGADDFLLKPIGKKALIAKLMQAVEKRQANRPAVTSEDESAISSQ